MRNILAALAVIIGIGVSLAGGIGIAVIGFPSNATATAADPLPQVQENSPFQGHAYNWCVPLNMFIHKMKINEGVLASSGNTENGRVSVFTFPDSSFGVFIFNPETGIVCLISTGWFEEPLESVINGDKIGFLVEEMKPPRSKPEPLFAFQCSDLKTFTWAMKRHGGKLVASNENPRRDRVISVIAFPDTSFGMFTYDPRSGQVCLLSTGWFVLPGSDA